MTRRTFRLAAVLLVLVGACAPRGEIPVVLHEVEGDRTQRIAVAASWIAPVAPGSSLPSVLLDARCAEMRIRDEFLGPSDSRLFCTADIDPKLAQRWIEGLTCAFPEPEYTRPGQPLSWWLSEAKFERLERFEALPKPGWGGWIAVDRQAGRIYFFGFST